MNIKKQSLIVSVQAASDEPFYKYEAIKAMMRSVLDGGADGLRVAGVRDIKLAKELCNLPIIGITKPELSKDMDASSVYITPTLSDIKKVIDAGADIVAFDATSRLRPDGSSIKDNVELIKKRGCLSMADISTLDEGIYARQCGVDIVSTTLSGYTNYSRKSEEPDFDLLEELVRVLDCPVILEGRICEPWQVKKAFECGAYAVVVGSAITRPHVITERFKKNSH